MLGNFCLCFCRFKLSLPVLNLHSGEFAHVEMKTDVRECRCQARSRPKCYTIDAYGLDEGLEHTHSAYDQLSPFQFIFFFLILHFLFLFSVVFHFYIEDNVELKCGDGK